MSVNSTDYRMVKTLAVKNFGKSATVKHWRKKLSRIDAQKDIGRLPHVKMTVAMDSMIRGYHE